MKCKHDYGWSAKKDIYIFVYEDLKRIVGDFQYGKTCKIKMRCNVPDCNAERNIYIKMKVEKIGKIKVNKR